MIARALLPTIAGLAAALAGCASPPHASAPPRAPAPPPPGLADPLYDTIAALDATVFDAFNHCGAPDELQRHAGYFAADVEFYHDAGGVTWTRDAMLANTAKYVCGKFRRELVPATLRVYPIKDFGAVAQGVHRFCQLATGACEGIADFVILWRRTGERWEITRVISYGHRALP